MCLERSQKAWKGVGRILNQRSNRDHPNYSIVENGQNTEKNPRNLRRLAGTMTQVSQGVWIIIYFMSCSIKFRINIFISLKNKTLKLSFADIQINSASLIPYYRTGDFQNFSKNKNIIFYVICDFFTDAYFCHQILQLSYIIKLLKEKNNFHTYDSSDWYSA